MPQRFLFDDEPEKEPSQQPAPKVPRKKRKTTRPRKPTAGSQESPSPQSQSAEAEGERTASGERILSVSQLTRHIKSVLERRFGEFWISGEISNLSQPQSGHCYFTLKDERASIRAVVWRSTARRLRFELQDGLKVIGLARLDVYPPRGTYQLDLLHLEPRGVGALQLALEQLQAKLRGEGLFDPRHKQPLPRFPRRVGVITSPTGAAIHDFLEVLRRRFRGTNVLIIPARVQGGGAGQTIADAIARGNRLAERLGLEMLVVGRGGGSLEDLWAFNEEVVARAIFASRLPVMSAVGHEIDVTIADLVADVRALTPSEAAERIVPSQDELTKRLKQCHERLSSSLRARLAAARRALRSVEQRGPFRRPFERVHLEARRLDELAARSERAVRQRLQRSQHKLQAVSSHLHSLSPLAVLGRGYSITLREQDGTLVRQPQDAPPGERILTRLADGEIVSRVENGQD